MSNNYTLFSEELVVKGSDEEKEEQRRWLTHQMMTTVGYWKDQELGKQVYFMEDEVPPNYANLLDPTYYGPKFLTDWPDLDETEPCKGFQMADGLEGVIIYAEENGEPAKVAWLVQKFLQTFDPDADWAMEWACTCSKPRPGGFGGGCMLVTAKSADYFDTYTAICDKRQAMAERTKDVGQKSKSRAADAEATGLAGTGDGLQGDVDAPSD